MSPRSQERRLADRLSAQWSCPERRGDDAHILGRTPKSLTEQESTAPDDGDVCGYATIRQRVSQRPQGSAKPRGVHM
jgi:hypothetical protein